MLIEGKRCSKGFAVEIYFISLIVMDYSSEEECEFDIDVDVDVNNVKPYMYEPLAGSGPSGDEEQEEIVDVDTHRIGNVHWYVHRVNFCFI